MTHLNTPNGGAGIGKPIIATAHAKPNPAAYSKPQPVPAKARNNPKDTAQEAVHEVQSKASAKAAATPAPSTAAKGDDDAMSKPAKRS